MSLYLNKNNDLFISYGNDDIFIDKSNLIKECNSLFGSSNSYMCVTRLRQVGKSYIVSKFANEQYVKWPLCLTEFLWIESHLSFC